MSITSRVLDGLGPAFRARAGDLLPGLVGALLAPVDLADQLVEPTAGGWARAFDVPTTPDPHWLGGAVGTQIPSSLDVEGQRTYLATQPAWRRGTVPAMKAAARTILVGLTKRVDILERTDGSPYRFGLRVWASELPGGDTAPLVTAALTQKPVGLLTDVTVDVVPYDATFAHLTAVHGTFAELTDRFPTFALMTPHVPEEGTIF